MNAAALTSFFTSTPPHFGQAGIGALTFTSCSNRFPHDGHSYS